jgi:hypothetical protein
LFVIAICGYDAAQDAWFNPSLKFFQDGHGMGNSPLKNIAQTRGLGDAEQRELLMSEVHQCTTTSLP